jgi:adenylate cyclase
LMQNVLPHRSPEQVKWFMNDTDLDPIRTHPRYPELLKTIGSKRAGSS